MEPVKAMLIPAKPNMEIEPQGFSISSLEPISVEPEPKVSLASQELLKAGSAVSIDTVAFLDNAETIDHVSHPATAQTTSEIFPIAPPETPTSIYDTAAFEISSKILGIINRYALRRSPEASAKAEGTLNFLALIYGHVKANTAVPMCLPAFPFKSPNSTLKVLGNLPDKAEEWALAHLNGLCQAIGDIYPPGAELTIISDGLVYNGTSDPTAKSRRACSILTL